MEGSERFKSIGFAILAGAVIILAIVFIAYVLLGILILISILFLMIILGLIVIGLIFAFAVPYYFITKTTETQTHGNYDIDEVKDKDDWK
jgi:uncharacterized RDD family membrane protein YckC